MKEKNGKKIRVRASKECAYLAAFVALLIVVQLCLSLLPGIELVTVLFVSYAFIFGVKRGGLAATAFSLLRQLVFGFYPTVFILYVLYYNLLALAFGFVGKKAKLPRALWWIAVVACVGTAIFVAMDNIITPLWYGYDFSAMTAYWISSIPFLLPQLICTAVTVSLLFIPLTRAFAYAKRKL